MAIILFIMFFVSLVGLDFCDYKPFWLFCIVSVVLAVIGIAHIILLCTAVRNNSKDKNIASGMIWCIFTFLIGLPCWILYSLFTFNAGSNKSNRKNRTTVCVSVLLLAVFISGAYILISCSSEYSETHFTTNYVNYKNSENEDIIYDKAGNEYTFEELENFRYYDRDGNSYYADYHYDIFSNIPETDNLKCIETGEEYDISLYNFYIDKDGYIVIFSLKGDIVNVQPQTEYQNDDTFYNLDFVCWTPDGELIFDYFENISKYETYTYQEILENISF